MTTVGNIVLWGSAVYHIFVGVLCLLSVDLVRKIGRALYGLKIPSELDPKYEFVWKPLGAYAIFTGLVSLRAVLVDDVAYRHFAIHVLALLFALRALSRFVYRELFQRAFDVTWHRNLANISFNAVLVAVMLLTS